MSFNDPHWLWALTGLPLLVVLEWLAARRADRAFRRLVGERPGSPLLAQRIQGSRRLGAALRLSAFVLLVLGAAGPTAGRELVRRAAHGSNVVLALDVSASMDTRDLPPSRLEEARREALAVLDRLEGSRVAVVAFAGDAVRLCPLTLDRSAARLVLESLSSSSVSEPGTDLGRGLRACLRVLPGGRREEQAVILWTDGEDLEHGARAAGDEMANAGVRLFAIGVGTRNGDVVPVLDDQGRAVDVKKDANGGPVVSRLDEALLRGLARHSGGAYFSASRAGGELPRLMGALGSLARAGMGERLVERPVARFPLCAAGAALLLIAELARPRRRVARAGATRPDAPEAAGPPKPAPAQKPAASSKGTAPEKAAAAAALALALVAALALWAPAARAESDWARADRAFKAGRWAEAESLYARRAARGAPAEVRVNLATARARRGQQERAERDLKRLAASDTRAGRAAGYNLGTLEADRGDYDSALGELRRALERDPGDRDARWNYEVALRRKQQREDQKRPPSGGQSPKPSGGEGGGATPRSQPAAPQAGPSGASSPDVPEAQAPNTGGRGMNRAQAERLLASLEDLERLERQRKRKAQAMKEKHGRDW